VIRLKPAGRTNIAEVAAAAGVSVGTVSRVLNDSPNVRDVTRQRVLEVMQRLQYRPSRLATRLSRGSPGTVVLVVPFLTRPSVVARLAGAIAVLDEQGYDAVLCNVETPAQLERHLQALTARHGAEGAVIMSLRLGREHLAALRDALLPLVLLDAEAPGVPCTVTDDIRGGELAVGHLLSLGHRRIGFIGDRRDPGLGFMSTRRRLLGYRRALASAGVRYDPALVRRGEHSAAAAGTDVVELLALPAPPTAIFAASDTQALGVLAAAERVGRSVPADLAVIGYDDIDSAAQLGLSTVRQPLRESGSSAASRLCAVIRGEKIRPLREQLPVTVVTRATTARLNCRPVTPARAGPDGGSVPAAPADSRTWAPPAPSRKLTPHDAVMAAAAKSAQTHPPVKPEECTCHADSVPAGPAQEPGGWPRSWEPGRWPWPPAAAAAVPDHLGRDAQGGHHLPGAAGDGRVRGRAGGVPAQLGLRLLLRQHPVRIQGRRQGRRRAAADLPG